MIDGVEIDGLRLIVADRLVPVRDVHERLQLQRGAVGARVRPAAERVGDLGVRHAAGPRLRAERRIQVDHSGRSSPAVTLPWSIKASAPVDQSPRNPLVRLLQWSSAAIWAEEEESPCMETWA